MQNFVDHGKSLGISVWNKATSYFWAGKWSNQIYLAAAQKRDFRENKKKRSEINQDLIQARNVDCIRLEWCPWREREGIVSGTCFAS